MKGQLEDRRLAEEADKDITLDTDFVFCNVIKEICEIGSIVLDASIICEIGSVWIGFWTKGVFKVCSVAKYDRKLEFLKVLGNSLSNICIITIEQNRYIHTGVRLVRQGCGCVNNCKGV